MRYFYSDALSVAFMAKHYGMKFKTPRGQNMYFDGGSDFRTEKDCGVFAGDKYHIHPDSLHLLEPKAGDLLQSTTGSMGGTSAGYLSDKSWKTNPEKWTITPRYGDGSMINAHWATPSEWQRIILRNGMAFHWPESEEA